MQRSHTKDTEHTNELCACALCIVHAAWIRFAIFAIHNNIQSLSLSIFPFSKFLKDLFIWYDAHRCIHNMKNRAISCFIDVRYLYRIVDGVLLNQYNLLGMCEKKNTLFPLLIYPTTNIRLCKRVRWRYQWLLYTSRVACILSIKFVYTVFRRAASEKLFARHIKHMVQEPYVAVTHCRINNGEVGEMIHLLNLLTTRCRWVTESNLC